jgi:hypothetical protein
VDAVNEDNGNDEDEDEGQEAVASAEVDAEEPEVEAAADGAKLSMKERMEKMKELRGRMVSLRLLILQRNMTNLRTKAQQPTDAI